MKTGPQTQTGRVATPRAGHVDAFRCQELYDLIHSLQPQVLVSYKDGLTGTEDFFAPEAGWDFEQSEDKPAEICACMSGGWGYNAGTPHKDADAVWAMLGDVRRKGCNLLLNTGPLPDGSIDPTDETTLRAVGRRLEQEGFPEE